MPNFSSMVWDWGIVGAQTLEILGNQASREMFTPLMTRRLTSSG